MAERNYDYLKKYQFKSKKKKTVDPTVKATQDMVDKSIDALKVNSKDMEVAIENVLKEEGIKISKEEYAQIKALTDTASELDSILNSIDYAVKETKKAVKKKTTKRKK